MAVTRIDAYHEGANLKEAVDYIKNKNKTNDGLYTDSYMCDYERALMQWENVRDKQYIKSGNIIAWRIKQNFAPTDNVTPEVAMEIGKKLMERMYPGFQYLIATHTDKPHIHNHIIVNSVSFETYRKLQKDIYKLRRVSDELCKEYGLSVIEKKTKTKELKKAIDDAIENNATFEDFIAHMQEKGYEVQIGQYISFKNEEMGKFIRTTSISRDYSETMIRSRLETKNPAVMSKRTVYDDKIKYRSKRKKLQSEIDASIKKANNFADFIFDMQDKGYTIKNGAHIAFRENVVQKNGKKPRFIRGDSISLHYSEAAIKWRIENKEVYADMISENAKLSRVIDTSKMDGGLYNWACGENGNIKMQSKKWITDNFFNGKDISFVGNGYLLFGTFLEHYNEKLNLISELSQKLDDINADISYITKLKKAVEQYWEYKPMFDFYKKADVNSLSDDEVAAYKRIVGKMDNICYVLNQANEKNQTLKISELNQKLKELREQRDEVGGNLIKEQIEFEAYETVKYNYEFKDGWDMDVATTERKYSMMKKEQETRRKEQEQKEALKNIRKERRKNTLKSLFGRD